MTIVRIPTPLRPYVDGQKELDVLGDTVAAALEEIARRYPAIRVHLFDGRGALRPYVNLFLNEHDVRLLAGAETRLQPGDQLMIIPSIAGGADAGTTLRPIDHAALRTNQAMIIALLVAAFLADAAWLSALVGGIMLTGSLLGKPGFLPVYRLLQATVHVRPDIVDDNNSPHRFAQGLGGVFLALALGAFVGGLSWLGWALSLLVALLAGLNLFGGFCVGCAVYYWLNRLGLPGFTQSPPAGVTPGRRPMGRD